MTDEYRVHFEGPDALQVAKDVSKVAGAAGGGFEMKLLDDYTTAPARAQRRNRYGITTAPVTEATIVAYLEALVQAGVQITIESPHQEPIVDGTAVAYDALWNLRGDVDELRARFQGEAEKCYGDVLDRIGDTLAEALDVAEEPEPEEPDIPDYGPHAGAVIREDIDYPTEPF